MEEKGVADTSFVKWFLEEEHSAQALALRDLFATGKIELHAPALMHYEFIDTLCRSKQFTRDELVLAARSFSKYGFRVWGPEGDAFEATAALCGREGISAYDAAYVALAHHLKAKLYTADEELLGRFPDVALHIRDIKVQEG